MALSLNKPKLDNLAGDIWKSAERLRGKFKAYEYQSVILPIIVIRRLECVLIDWREKKAAEVLGQAAQAHREGTRQAGQGTGAESQAVPVFQQDRLDAAQGLRGRPRAAGGELPRLHQRLLEERRRHHRALQLPRHHRPDGEEQPARPNPEPIQGTGARPRPALRPGDGLHLRGTAPALLGTKRRGGRRTLHPARSHPAHGRVAGDPHPGPAPLHLRPRLRHRRHVVRGEGTSARPRRHTARKRHGSRSSSPSTGRSFPPRTTPSVRPICSSRTTGRPRSTSATRSSRTTRTARSRATSAGAKVALRLHAEQSALRRHLGRQGRLREGSPQAGEDPLPGRDAARERRCAAFPANHAGQDAAAGEGRQPHRHHLQRLAALQRRLRLGRERNPPLDSGERLARRHRHAARPAFLQHRHLHLHLAAAKRQARQPSRAA